MSRFDIEKDAYGDLLAGEPRFRADQLFDGLYRQFLDPDEITVLPGALRLKLADSGEFAKALSVSRESVTDDGETFKWLFALEDGNVIETVLMLYPRRAT